MYGIVNHSFIYLKFCFIYSNINIINGLLSTVRLAADEISYPKWFVAIHSYNPSSLSLILFRANDPIVSLSVMRTVVCPVCSTRVSSKSLPFFSHENSTGGSVWVSIWHKNDMLCPTTADTFLGDDTILGTIWKTNR